MSKEEPTPELIEQEMGQIDQLLLELKEFESDRKNRAVDSALAIAKEKFTAHPNWIPQGVVVLYHGSLQYNDPRNLDFDLDFVADNFSYELLDLAVRVGSNFEGGEWPNPYRCSANAGLIGLDIIKQYVPSVLNRAEGEDLNNSSVLDASIILGGKLLFGESKEQLVLLEKFQNEVRDLTRVNTSFRRGIIDQLVRVKGVRVKRREISSRVR